MYQINLRKPKSRQAWTSQVQANGAIWRLGESRPVSRVLSWAIIHLGLLSPVSSSDLPEDVAGSDMVFLFGLAPGGVYLAASCYQLRGALLPHHFTLTGAH